MNTMMMGALALSLGLATSASADGFGYANEAALAHLSATLNQISYEGVTPFGSYCKVQVVKMGGVVGGFSNQMMISGYDDLPGFPILRASGFFQIGLDSRFFWVTEFSDTPESLRVNVLTVDPTGLSAGAYSRTAIAITRNGAGNVVSIGTRESSVDPISNGTYTREFNCGQRL